MRWLSYIVAFGVLTVSGESIAADWLDIGRAEDGTIVLLDLNSMRRLSTGVQLWVKLDYRTKSQTEADRKRARVAQQLADRGMLACNGRRSPFCQPGDNRETELRALWRIECAERSLTILSSTVYGSDGRVLRTETVAAPPATPIVPDTIAESVLGRVCPSEQDGR